MRAKEKARARKQYAEIQDSFQQLRKESKDMLNSGTNISISTDRLGDVQKKLDDAANALKGEEAQVVKATSAYMLRGQNLLKAYSTAMNAISEPSAVDMSRVTNKAEVAVRRLAVQHFLEANQKLMAFYQDDETPMREELVRFKIPQLKIESLMEGYRKSKPMRQIVVKIRQTDVQLGNSMVAMLDLLENNWGRWRHDRETKMVVFEDDLIVEKYNAHLEEMNAAAELQKKLQAQLAKRL